MMPSVSIATGMKSCVMGGEVYLRHFLSAACSAAPPVIGDVRWVSEDAQVCMIIDGSVGSRVVLAT